MIEHVCERGLETHSDTLSDRNDLRNAGIHSYSTGAFENSYATVSDSSPSRRRWRKRTDVVIGVVRERISAA